MLCQEFAKKAIEKRNAEKAELDKHRQKAMDAAAADREAE
jgi:hypothetical protein